MQQADAKVLGIDTALRCSGLGVVALRGREMEAVDYGVVLNKPALARSECVCRLRAGVLEFIDKYKPAAAAIEGIFFCRNVRTAIALGEARGAVISAVAAAGVPIYEYAPRRVKSAVVGYGNASKEQVRLMIMSLLRLSRPPPEDAADALALAVCHLNAARRPFEAAARRI